jgi:hypothetical protein
VDRLLRLSETALGARRDLDQDVVVEEERRRSVGIAGLGMNEIIEGVLVNQRWC